MGIPKGYVLTKEQIEILKNFADAPLDDGPQGSGPTDPPTPIPVPRTNPPTPTPVPSPSHPFDLAPHEPELVAPTIPGFKPTKDRTKNFMGFGGGGPAEHRELLQDLARGIKYVCCWQTIFFLASRKAGKQRPSGRCQHFS